MNDPKFIRCTPVCTDGASRLNTVQRLPDGRLFTVAVFGKAYVHGHFSKQPVTQYLMGRVSEDEGKTWQESTFFYVLPDRDAMYMQGCFLIDRDGRIHIFMLHIQNISDSISGCIGGIMYCRMEDEHGTGLICRKIKCLDRYTGAMNNFIQISSGRLVAPFSTAVAIEGCPFVSSCIYSDDGGDTWQVSNDVAITSDESHIESGAVEPVVLEVQPGVLLMLIRTVLNYIWYSVSYDGGATWGKPQASKIPSSNAPSVPLVLKDGRILLVWNDVLGYPMTGVRYSCARQCLHAAVSDDGLKTLKGVRIITRKQRKDPDRVTNCYPFATYADEKEVFIRQISIGDGDDTHWGDPQAALLRLNPDDLQSNFVENNFEEWVTDCDADQNGIRLRPTVGGLAYAVTDFPYATFGRATLSLSGTIPENAALIVSDSYLDRATFLPEHKTGNYADVVGKPYVEIPLPNGCGGAVEIEWNADRIMMTCGNTVKEIPLSDWNRGFNQLAVTFTGEGAVDITDFSVEAIAGAMETGIVY